MATRYEINYEHEALTVLIYEFPSTNKAESERKIRGRLRRKKLGQYDPELIALLRKFKDELQKEIGSGKESKYFIAQHGYYCNMSDFDVPRLTARMIKRFPTIPKSEVEIFVPFAVACYYLL